MPAKHVEKWSFNQLILSLVIVVFICALGYYILSFYGNGIISTSDKNKEITFFDGLYFSVITVSSLGYVDFRPSGFGRVIASLEVIAGLIIIALIVAKMASERTAVYVKLLYSSDNERRLKSISRKIENHTKVLALAQKEYDHDKKLITIKRIIALMANITRYYTFQSTVGALDEEWATKNSFRIIRSTSAAMEQLAIVGKLEVTNKQENRSGT
jgi:hypothetical protein